MPGFGARVVLFAALLAGGFPSAAAVPDRTDPAQVAEFVAAPGARTGCLRLDLADAAGAVCFDVHVTGGPDPSRDYFTWRFTAEATATEGRELRRLRVRLGGRRILERWEPRDLRPVDGAPVTLEVPGAASVGFDPPPGQLRAFADDTLYHVSWLAPPAPDEGCCPAAEVGGVTVWSVPRGTGMTARFRLEATLR